MWMHVYRCVTWLQTSYISVLWLDADCIENSLSFVEVCLLSRCLATPCVCIIFRPCVLHIYFDGTFSFMLTVTPMWPALSLNCTCYRMPWALGTVILQDIRTIYTVKTVYTTIYLKEQQIDINVPTFCFICYWRYMFRPLFSVINKMLTHYSLFFFVLSDILLCTLSLLCIYMTHNRMHTMKKTVILFGSGHECIFCVGRGNTIVWSLA
jgi:hypothetical protein